MQSRTAARDCWRFRQSNTSFSLLRISSDLSGQIWSRVNVRLDHNQGGQSIPCERHRAQAASRSSVRPRVKSRGLRDREPFDRSTSWKYVRFPLLPSPHPVHQRSHKHTEPDQHARNDQYEQDGQQGISSSAARAYASWALTARVCQAACLMKDSAPRWTSSS
jgi:hypothetical protein